MSAMLRQRALEADRAKLAFVSQISHELYVSCSTLYRASRELELMQAISVDVHRYMGLILKLN